MIVLFISLELHRIKINSILSEKLAAELVSKMEAVHGRRKAKKLRKQIKIFLMFTNGRGIR
jgi:hypothetical protein